MTTETINPNEIPESQEQIVLEQTLPEPIDTGILRVNAFNLMDFVHGIIEAASQGYKLVTTNAGLPRGGMGYPYECVLSNYVEAPEKQNYTLTFVDHRVVGIDPPKPSEEVVEGSEEKATPQAPKKMGRPKGVPNKPKTHLNMNSF